MNYCPSAEEALIRLTNGNQRFMAGNQIHPNQSPDHRIALRDGLPPELAGGIAAAQRGCVYANAVVEQWPPYIAAVNGPESIENGSGKISARVLDDGSLEHVWAVVYPPSYQQASDREELVQEVLPTIDLAAQGNDR